MRKIYILFFVFMSLNLLAQETYKNPINMPFNGFGIGDPATFRWMGKYYLIASTGPVDSGLNCWQSEDLVNWTHVGIINTDYKNDAAGHDAWAPEIIYYEGTFYMYYAHPNQNTRVAKFELPLDYNAKYPLGPFTTVSTNLIPQADHDIDASPFRDNNGDLYVLVSAPGGIEYIKMDTPTSIGSNNLRQLTSCVTRNTDGRNSNWTEGPTVIYVDGTYYMTYCGNDVSYPQYQIHAAKGNSLAGLSAQSNNPIIRKTTGNWTGTGHNHWILGPDMKTYYTTYHVKRGDYISDGSYGRHLHRRLMLDKIEFDTNGNMVTNAPTFNEQPVPALPNWSDDFNRSNIGNNWSFTEWEAGSNYGLYGNMLMWMNSKNQGGHEKWWAKAISEKQTADDFVVEFNLKLMGTGDEEANAHPKFGVFVSQQTIDGDDEGKIMYIALNTKTMMIETLVSSNKNPNWQGDGVSLGNTDFSKWHTIKVKKVGDKVEIYYDNMLKITKIDINLGGGHIGFITENTHADFGWVGFSNIDLN